MKNQLELHEKLTKYNLVQDSIMPENKSAFIITKEKNGIKITITIPLNVYEIFLEAKDLSGQKTVVDWRDYYGNNQEKDYFEELDKILFIISEKDIRFSQDTKTIEYKDSNWKYFWGKRSESGNVPKGGVS